MLTGEKIKETRKRLSKGIPEGEIKNELKAEGYSEDDIKKIFAPHTPDMRSWLLVSGIFVLVAGFYLFLNSPDRPFLMMLLSGVLFFEYYKQEQKLKAKKKD